MGKTLFQTFQLIETSSLLPQEVMLTEGAFESAALALRRTPLFDQISNSSATSSRPSTPAFPFPPFPPFAGLANFADSPISIYTFLQQQGLIGGPRHRSEEGFSSTLIRCAICWAGFPTTWLLEQHTALQHSGQPVRGKTEEGMRICLICEGYNCFPISSRKYIKKRMVSE